jgi:ubiquinone/menaquinone biosynthesis C-methylase UbiE
VTEYDSAADGYDARHARDPAARRRNEVLDGIQLSAVDGARCVLEIGCGTGRLLSQVRARVALGVDLSARMLAYASARDLAVARADAHQLPFRDGAFDAVIAGKGVFRYLDPPRAFAECRRVLQTNGILGLHNYGNRTWSPRGNAVPEGSLWELGSVEELTTMARGFAVVAMHRFRPIRIYPYLLEIPSWLDRRAPVQLWSHLVAILRVAA